MVLVMTTPWDDQLGTPRRVYVFDPDELMLAELIVARYAIAHPEQFSEEERLTMREPVKVNDTVIYQYKRWQVIDTISVRQSPDYSVPCQPNKLRLMRGHDAVTVTVDQVVLVTRDGAQ